MDTTTKAKTDITGNGVPYTTTIAVDEQSKLYDENFFTAPVNGVYKFKRDGIKLIKRLKKGETINLTTGKIS